ncbi:hypothetical protein GMOD_00004860 [Pyrenophora seminiperda CCB06]|uniref:Uncharacterized protein n=1 Tax=Pyrenophora seminiperda CCB06 TaxID=1302712 RepID=A0A3M7MHM7_9PLEO|nr:hypothetical protein GMOD_00004860 [Pyrenophora seminiperda CCB06]
MGVTIVETGAAVSCSKSSPGCLKALAGSLVSEPIISQPQLDLVATIDFAGNKEPRPCLPRGPRLSECSSIFHPQSLMSCFGLDRDHWHHLALKQALALTTLRQSLENYKVTTCSLSAENTHLHSRHYKHVITIASLTSSLQSLAIKNEQLMSNLAETARSLLQLRKSDRAKGKVHQRNLRLKSILNRFSKKGVAARAKADADTEAALKEALAAAWERIEELEARGEALLDALDDHDHDHDHDHDDGNSDGSENGGGMGCEVGHLEAEVAFRGALEDEAFRAMRDEWESLLGE